MSLRIPLGIHDYSTGKKMQKNFQMVAKEGGCIELRGRGPRNIWMRDKQGKFIRIANGQTLPLEYAKKVAVYLVYPEPIDGTDKNFKDITRNTIKRVRQKKDLKKHYKSLD